MIDNLHKSDQRLGNHGGATGGTSTLEDLSKRLARELNDLPDHPAVADVFDYLAGAIFSLKHCAALPFLNRKGGQVAGYKKILSRYLSAIPEGRSPNPYWVCGFYFNSAMVRIAACYDRIPKMILKRKKGKAHKLMESVWGDSSSYPKWKAVYKEVNKLKHAAVGLGLGRGVSMGDVMAALLEIVSLLEAKKIDIISAYHTT